MKFNELIERLQLHNIKLDEQYGEVFAEDEKKAFELDLSLEQWADWIAQKYNDATMKEKAAIELAEKYKDRAAMFARDAEWRKRGLFELVNLAGKTIKTPTATIYKGKAQPSLDLPDESAVPEEFLVVKKSPDRKAIADSLKAGKEFNWCSLREGKEFVVIRV